MQALIAFALSQRLLLLVGVAVLVVAGWSSFAQLPIDAFPDVSPTQVKVILKSPGMTPEEVESRITIPVELELLGIPRQTMLRSTSKYALSDITLDFAQGTDIYWARQQVAERMAAVRGDLPDGVTGGMAPMTTPLGEMFMFTIEGGGLSLMERRRLLDWTIRPALRSVPGVADVNALGGEVRTYEVVPDPDRLAARSIPLDALREALASNNRNGGAGRIVEGEETLLMRTEGRIEGLDDVRSIVVATRDGVPVTVADLALVRIGALTRYGAVTHDGQGEAVEGLVLGLRGANAGAVVAGVRAKLATLAPALPEGVEVNVFYDRGDLVSRAVGTVTRALGEASLLVFVLLLLFLGQLRAALAVVVVLPLAVLATFILMGQAGMSANLMSLGGLAIAIGILVDGAVVVVENIVEQMSHPAARGVLPRLHIIYRATREVAPPVASGIVIIMVVFMPLLSLQGLEGLLFSPVAVTICFALASSLLLALTVIPVVSSLLLGEGAHAEPFLPRLLNRAYQPVLRTCLRHSGAVVLVALALMASAAWLYTQVGKTFMPTMDEGDLIVQLEKIPSITLEESVSLDLAVQRAILEQVPEVRRVVARVGSDEIGLDPMGLNDTDSFLVLAPREEWAGADKESVIERIRQVLEAIPGVAYGFTQPIEMRVSEMLTGVRGDVAAKLFGPELPVLNAKAEEVAAVLARIPGASDVFTAQNEGLQYLTVKVDRIAAGRLGLDADMLEATLRAQIEGEHIGIVQEGVERTPLVLRGLGREAAAFTDLLITTPDGEVVPLGSVARLERTDGVVSVARERGQRFTVIRSNVTGRDLVGFVEEARQGVEAGVELPPGYFIEWGGQFENQQRAAARLAVVVPVAISLVFLLLMSTFGSLRQAAIVLANIPFALIGGVYALYLSGEYLSVPASVGFIALLGIAVLNGVVMVSYFNQLAARGLPAHEVVVEGASRRLRPVLMTASIAALGLVPLLFATGPGSEIQRPLAIVVIGGLVSATALTLILLPILYRRFGLGTPS